MRQSFRLMELTLVPPDPFSQVAVRTSPSALSIEQVALQSVSAERRARRAAAAAWILGSAAGFGVGVASTARPVRAMKRRKFMLKLVEGNIKL